jgi:predicted acylesterase/phospholipase RssA
MNSNDGKTGKIVAICWAVVVVLTIGISLLVVVPDWDKGSTSRRKSSHVESVKSSDDDKDAEKSGEDESAAATGEEVTEATTQATTTEMTTQATTEEQAQTGEDGYVIPDSDSRYLTEADLRGFSKEQLRLARNEIYARHGRRFKDDELQSYFNSKSWYTGTIDPDDFSESMLNEYEKANTALIKQEEDTFN